MKKSVIIALIVAAVLVAAGVTCVLVALNSAGYDLQNLDATEYTMETVTVDGNFKYIDLSENYTDIQFRLSDDEYCHIEYPVIKNVTRKYEIIQPNTTPIFTNTFLDTREWYDRINVVWKELPPVTVYLPKDKYDSLKLKCTSGDITINNDIFFSSSWLSTQSGDIDFSLSNSPYADLNTQSGNITYHDLSDGYANLTTQSGDIFVYNVYKPDVYASAQSGDITVKDSCANICSVKTVSGDVYGDGIVATSWVDFTATSGDIYANKVNCEQLHLITVSGDVEFNDIDGGSFIDIETVSGDVDGCLPRPMKITAETESGSVDVPEDTSNNSDWCKVETVSGDITIEAPQ